MAPCVLVTGSAKRIGAAVVRELHAAGFSVIIHFRESRYAAVSLNEELNDRRAGSAAVLQADLAEVADFEDLARRAISVFGRIDGLVNNASSFYSTPPDSATQDQWDELIGCNLKAPFFLSLAFARELAQRSGTIVNITDIHGLRPLKGYPIYSISQAGLNAMTQALARELAPSVRVNGVAPGAVLWPENSMTKEERERIVEKIALSRTGLPVNIAEAVLFLFKNDYITGQIIAVDGGRTLYS